MNRTSIESPTASSKTKGPLTPIESARLAELEPIIERGMASFVEVGNALLEISGRRLYRETASTFEQYCRDKWHMTARRAYQLCEAAEVVKALPENVNHGSQINERQARELAKIEPEKRTKALEVASSKGKLTAKSIRIAVVNVESAVTLGEAIGKTCSAPPAREQIIGLRPDLADALRDDPSAPIEAGSGLPKPFVPRARSKINLQCWYWVGSTTPAKRGDFLASIICGYDKVKVPDRRAFEDALRQWMDKCVVEAKT